MKNSPTAYSRLGGDVARIRIDSNDLVRGGLVRAYLSSTDAALEIGDPVIAADCADCRDIHATVVAVEGQKVYLDLDWEA